MESTVAIIDMGTNTFHLLVAKKQDGKFIVIHRDRESVKIGKGGINDGRITDSAIDRAVTTLKKFKSITDSLSVKKIFAFGTSALRSAANSNEVCDRIQQETGIEVKVISGDEEAGLIYRGIRAGLNLGTEKSLIVDIGGGSVEFIIANGEEVFWKKSLEIGGQRLLELFHRHDPILPEEIKELDAYLLQKMESVFEQLKIHHPVALVGSSGTFDTLSEMYCAQKGIPYDADSGETPLTFESFRQLYHDLVSKDRNQRMQIPGMIELRVDMIVVACVIIRVLIERHTFRQLRVCTYSLKEGALASLN